MANHQSSNGDHNDARFRKKSTTFAPDLNLLDGHGLPEGSTLFQEVMAELHPDPPLDPSHTSALKSPATRRRKVSSHTKHVHYEGDGVKGHKATGEEEKARREKEEEEGRQILHGKCHCYFVEKGNVTGLADHRCHHEHRHFAPSHSPAVSPTPTRRISRTRTPSQTPSPPAELSPSRARSKSHTNPPPAFHSNPHHNSALLSPDLHEFRTRSHSDTTAMARLSVSKHTSSSSSSSLAASFSGRSGLHGRAAGPARSPARNVTPRGTPDRSPARARGSAGDLTKEEPLSRNSPPPIRVQDTTTGSESASRRAEERRRKISSHAVSSDQLHYLYHQYLHH